MHDPWAGGPAIRAVYDVDAAARAHLRTVTADDLWHLLSTAAEPFPQIILGTIGMHSPRALSKAAAAQILARLRSRKITDGAFEYGVLDMPMMHALIGELDPRVWAALLCASEDGALDSARTDIEAAVDLFDDLNMSYSAFTPLALMAAIVENLPTATIALSLLAATDQSAKDAWFALEAQGIELPELPNRTLADVTELLRISDLGDDPDDEDDFMDIATEDMGSEAVQAAMQSRDTGAVLTAIGLRHVAGQDSTEDEDLLLVFDQLTEVSGEVASALTDGDMPFEALAQMADWVSVLATVDLPAVGARGLLEARVEAAERAREVLERTAADRVWLTQMAGLTGHAGVADDLRVVTAAAAAHLAGDDAERSIDDLRALHHFLDLSQRHSDGAGVAFDDMLTSEGAARAAWTTIPGLMSAASYGFVTMPAPDRAVAVEPPVAARAEQDESKGNDALGDDDADASASDAGDQIASVDQTADDQPNDDDATVDTEATCDTGDTEGTDAETTSEDPAENTTEDSDNTDNSERDGEGRPDGQGEAPADDDPLVDPSTAADENPAPQPTAEDLDDFDDLSALDDLLDAGAAPALTAKATTKPAARPSVAKVFATPPTAVTADGAQEAAAVDPVAETYDATTTEGAWTSTAVIEAVAAATADLRLGLAADLALAAGAPEASVRARQLAAYGQQLRNPGGHLAAAFSAQAAHLRREDLGDDRPAQLLAWAAAARIALLAPNAGPARVLTELAPCIADRHALSAVGEALIDASRTGVVVLPETQAAIGNVTAAENGLEVAVDALENILATSNRRVLSYQPANAIYQEWMASTGELGATILTATNGTVADVSTVRKAVLDLRGQGERRAKAAHKRANRSNKIYEPVMRDLIARWENILSALDAWCDAITRMEATTEHVSTGGWQTAALATVRSRVADVREQALADLTAEDTSDVLTAATVEAVTDLLTAAFEACDGKAPSGEEPAPDLVIHGELLALAADDLPAGLRVRKISDIVAHLPELIDLATGDEPDPQDVYARLKAAGHHDQSQLLIALTRPNNPTLAQGFERDRGIAVNDRLGRRADSLAALRRRLDTQRMSGGLTEEDWSALSTRVDDLGEESRRDFGHIISLSERIGSELEMLRGERVEETVARIDERAAESPAVAAVAERLTDLANNGNIASAEEYLEQAASGGALPDEDPEGNMDLLRFYPSVPDAFAADLKTGEKLDRFFRTGDAAGLEHVVQAGLVLDDMPRGRVDEAKRAFGAMRALRQSATAKTIQHGALQHILAQAGLDFAHLTAEAPVGGARRRWVTLTGITTTGQALTPALGSGMSPEGTSLRVLMVWGDQQPQTMIEWVRDEAADRSVLALWLGRALSSEQRRDLAEAARGHSRPVVAVLDDAALAYLSAQPARSLEAFASIALPFTAASPYKDTPGDAPPEMFYGRRQELEHVMDPTGPSFVSGGRQLGKSALLRAAERRFPTGGSGRIALLRNIYPIGQDGDSSTLWPALWSDLFAKGICSGAIPHDAAGIAEAVHQAIRAWVDADATRGLLILLDEADAFLDADAAGNRFAAVDQCRRLMLETNRRVKFVFAGLHRTARFDSLPNQPLSHLGQITVGPLAPRHAHDLITRPLEALGFRYQDRVGTPARILALANNMPALLQLFGAALVRHLTSRPVEPGTPPSLITDEDVDTVWDDADLRRAFRDKYVLTLNLDHRYLVIAYTIAYAAHTYGSGHGLTLKELSDEVRMTWPQGFASCGADDFRALVSECVDLGLLTRDGNAYRMRTPTVLRLLGTQDEVIDTLATASERLVVPDATVVGSYRRRTHPGRSPLTERQLADVLSGLGGATLVTGCDATGLGHVSDALSAALQSKDVTTKARTVTALNSADPDDVTDTVKSADPGTVVVIDVRGSAPGTLLDLAAAAEKAAIGTSVGAVLLADASSASEWSSVSRRISLARIDLAGLRLLCDEEGLPFHNDDAVARLHTASGGWPDLVAHMLTRSAGANPAMTAEAIVTAARDYATAQRAALVRAALPPRTPLLGLCFDKVAELTSGSPEDRGAVVELLCMDEDSAFAQRVPGGCSAVEATVEHAVDALIDLGMIEVTRSGAIQAERVLARARRTDRTDA